MTFKESKTLTAGETPTIVDTGFVCLLNLLYLKNFMVHTIMKFNIHNISVLGSKGTIFNASLLRNVLED